MNVLIRDAGDADIGIIGDLAVRIWWPVYGPILEKEQISYMLEKLYSPDAIRRVMRDGSQRFLLLLEDDTPAGFAAYGDPPDVEAYIKVFKLYILPDRQGRGYGKMLLDEIGDRGRTSGAQAMVLNVNRNNPALRFYKKYGFSVLREEDIPIGPFFMNDYVMIHFFTTQPGR